MLALVLVHIAGVLLSSRLHHENLVRGMIDGYKRGAPDEAIRHRRWLIGVVLLAVVVGLWVALF